jgi:hypothetical protein
VIGILYALLGFVARVLIWAGFLGAAVLATLALYRPGSVPE